MGKPVCFVVDAVHAPDLPPRAVPAPMVNHRRSNTIVSFLVVAMGVVVMAGGIDQSTWWISAIGVGVLLFGIWLFRGNAAANRAARLGQLVPVKLTLMDVQHRPELIVTDLASRPIGGATLGVVEKSTSLGMVMAEFELDGKKQTSVFRIEARQLPIAYRFGEEVRPAVSVLPGTPGSAILMVDSAAGASVDVSA